MEAGPDAGIGNLFGKGGHAGPTVRDAGSRRTGQRDLGDVHGSECGLDNTRDAAALDAMRTRIFRVHWRGGNRLPGCVTLGGWVAIDIAVADGRARPPEGVHRLGV